MQKIFTVALVGRPNVGKSTIFNRLIGRKLAIVHKTPGVTRDYQEAKAHYGDSSYLVLDTPGLADYQTTKSHPELAKAMQYQTEAAIKQADMVAFVLDGAAGITAFDAQIAKTLFKANKPVIALINKADDKKSQLTEYDVYSLGFDNAILISAEHNLGFDAFYEAIASYLESPINEEQEIEIVNHPIKLAVMGRPNVGKSTLINALIGEDRLLTADMPGVTRDAISIAWEYQGQPFELIDTAGIRKKAKVTDAIESLAVISANKILQFAEVVILVVDATIPLEEQIEKQDLQIAQQVLEEGRILVIALNKSDKISYLSNLINHMHEQLNYQLSQAQGIAVVPISAVTKYNISKLLDAVTNNYKLWNTRIPTAKLNEWLSFMLEKHPTPAISGRRIRIKYMTQIKKRPPTFALFCTQAAELPQSYIRYLINGLRESFHMPGVPIRFMIKSIKNPYKTK